MSLVKAVGRRMVLDLTTGLGADKILSTCTHSCSTCANFASCSSSRDNNFTAFGGSSARKTSSQSAGKGPKADISGGGSGRVSLGSILLGQGKEAQESDVHIESASSVAGDVTLRSASTVSLSSQATTTPLSQRDREIFTVKPKHFNDPAQDDQYTTIHTLSEKAITKNTANSEDKTGSKNNNKSNNSNNANDKDKDNTTNKTDKSSLKDKKQKTKKNSGKASETYKSSFIKRFTNLFSSKKSSDVTTSSSDGNNNKDDNSVGAFISKNKKGDLDYLYGIEHNKHIAEGSVCPDCGQVHCPCIVETREHFEQLFSYIISE